MDKLSAALESAPGKGQFGAGTLPEIQEGLKALSDAGNSASTINNMLKEFLAGGKEQLTGEQRGAIAQRNILAGVNLPEGLLSPADQIDFTARLAQAAKTTFAFLEPGKILTNSEIDNVANSLIKGLGLSKEAQEAVKNQIQVGFMAQVDLNAQKPVSADVISGGVDILLKTASDNIDALQKSGITALSTEGLEKLKSQFDNAITVLNQSKPADAAAVEAKALAYQKIANEQLQFTLDHNEAALEKLSKTLGVKEFEDASARLGAENAKAAAEAGNVAALAEILNNSTKAVFNRIVADLRTAINETRNALKTALLGLQSMLNATGEAFAAGIPQGPLIGEKPGDREKFNQSVRDYQVKNQLLQNKINSVDAALAISTPSSEGRYGYGAAAQKADEDRKKAEAEKEKADSAAAVAAAAAEAEAARSRSATQQAQAQLQTATVGLQEAKRGTVAYYQALSQFYEAQNALVDAILDYQLVQKQLTVDLTDPVKAAQVDLEAAQAKLSAYQGQPGIGQEAIDRAQLDVTQKQNALLQTQFEQNLGDVQTNRDLDRISREEYIQYLEDQHDNLSAIAVRTRQQQEQLNRVDQLLKQASSELTGQFNLGDIKLPTVYEVRRYIASQTGGLMEGFTQGLIGAAGTAIKESTAGANIMATAFTGSVDTFSTASVAFQRAVDKLVDAAATPQQLKVQVDGGGTVAPTSTVATRLPVGPTVATRPRKL